MYCVKLADVFLSSAVTLRLSLKLFIRGHCLSHAVGQKVGGSARATLLLVKGMCPYSRGLGLTPDKFSEKTGTS